MEEIKIFRIILKVKNKRAGVKYKGLGKKLPLQRTTHHFFLWITCLFRARILAWSGGEMYILRYLEFHSNWTIFLSHWTFSDRLGLYFTTFLPHMKKGRFYIVCLFHWMLKKDKFAELDGETKLGRVPLFW